MKVFQAAGLAALALGVAGLPPPTGLRASLLSLVVQPRTGAPIPVEVQFTSSLSGVVEGWLEMDLREGRERKALYRCGPLVLTGGSQSVRMLLPHVSLEGSLGWVDVTMRFVTRKATYELGDHQLSAPSDLRQSFVICIASPWSGAPEARGELIRSLQIEHYDPEPEAAFARTYGTFAATVPTGDLPSHPLGYCAYDIVLLCGDGIRQMRARQMRALCRWVGAGGSACIIPEGVLQQAHLECLRELAGEDGPAFTLDPDGRLGADGPPPPGGFWMFHYGLGRVVVSPALPASLDSPQWRQAVAFLWKLRWSAWPGFVSDGKWRPEEQTAAQQGPMPGRTRRSVWPGPRAGGPEWNEYLSGALLPRTVRPVPLWALIAIFALFVLAVGPLDYAVLGVLKRRKLTWVLFPCLSVAFAAFTVLLTNAYLGVGDRRAALIVVDVGPGGRVLRWTRCEMAFMARDREVATHVEDALLAPVSSRWMRYEGRIPEDFVGSLSVRKWTPVFVRTLSLEPAETPFALNWDALDAVTLEELSGEEAAQALVRGTTFLGAVVVRSAGRWKGFRPGLQRGDSELTGGEVDLVLRLVRTELEDCVLSRVSPTGSGGLDDLAILDTTDPQQCLVVAIDRQGDDYVAVRRLYRGTR